MELYIGGCAQGKLEYVLRHRKEGRVIRDIVQIKERQEGEMLIFDQFHIWFQNRLQMGGTPEQEMDDILEGCRNLIVISDEVGNGIVPLEEEQRAYRERLGRYLCRIAQEADRVERIICGIGQVIKG